MKVEFLPSKLKGSITPPPSKSYAHRLLIAAALSHKKVKISNIDFNNDINETISVLRILGKDISMSGSDVILQGKLEKRLSTEFYVLESGSTLRFLIPIAMVFTNNIIIHCSPRLISRGIDVYIEAFRKKGIDIKIVDRDILIKGYLVPGEYEVKGNISSQYISGLLFALSLLDETSHLRVLKPIESQDYINMTLNVLNKAKVNISSNDYIFDIEPSEYDLPDSTVENDYSNAAFLDALNHIDGSVYVAGYNANSLQGDKIYKEYFGKLSRGYCELDISNCIDLGPVLFTVASLYKGAKFIGTHRLAIKESNRAIAMREELNKFGVSVDVYNDEVYVEPIKLHKPLKDISSHNDHRIAMAMSILCLKYGGSILGFESTKKSYPNYLKDIISLGGEAKIYD